MSGFMSQFPSSSRMIPSSYLLTAQWPQPAADEILLTMEEEDYEEQLNEIRKIDSNLVVIGKTRADNDKGDDNDADDDEADHVEESEADDFDQETS